MYRYTPNSDNHIDYNNKKSGKNICCPTCRQWKTAATFVNGVCALCDMEFKEIKRKDLENKFGKKIKTDKKLRLPPGI